MRGTIATVTAVVYGATLGHIVWGDPTNWGAVFVGLTFTVIGIFTVCVGLERRESYEHDRP